MITDVLIHAYRKAAVIHGDALEASDIKTCNAAFDELEEIRAKLRDTDPDYQTKILALLDDDHLMVRSSAASDALEFAPDEGARVLREIAAGPRGLIRLGAEMMLKRWEEKWVIED